MNNIIEKRFDYSLVIHKLNIPNINSISSCYMDPNDDIIIIESDNLKHRFRFATFKRALGFQRIIANVRLDPLNYQLVVDTIPYIRVSHVNAGTLAVGDNYGQRVVEASLFHKQLQKSLRIKNASSPK